VLISLQGNELLAQAVGANISAVSELAHLGSALRLLRERRGLKQFEAADRAGLAISVVNRAETGKGTSSLGTVAALLDLYGASFSDLGAAMREAEHGPAAVAGVARPAWVALLMRNGIRSEVLEGAALAAAHEANGAADLVASAVEAARQIAEGALAEVRRAELSLVAESPSDYDTGKGKR